MLNATWIHELFLKATEYFRCCKGSLYSQATLHAMPFHSPKFQQHYFPDGKPKNTKRTNFEIENRNISDPNPHSFGIFCNQIKWCIKFYNIRSQRPKECTQVNFTSTNALISDIATNVPDAKIRCPTRFWVFTVGNTRYLSILYSSL